jgi:hypothetical protein
VTFSTGWRTFGAVRSSAFEAVGPGQCRKENRFQAEFLGGVVN